MHRLCIPHSRVATCPRVPPHRIKGRPAFVDLPEGARDAAGEGFSDGDFTPATALSGIAIDPFAPELAPSALQWRRALEVFPPPADSELSVTDVSLLPSDIESFAPSNVLVGPDIPAFAGWSPLDDALQARSHSHQPQVARS